MKNWNWWHRQNLESFWPPPLRRHFYKAWHQMSTFGETPSPISDDEICVWPPQNYMLCCILNTIKVTMTLWDDLVISTLPFRTNYTSWWPQNRIFSLEFLIMFLGKIVILKRYNSVVLLFRNLALSAIKCKKHKLYIKWCVPYLRQTLLWGRGKIFLLYTSLGKKTIFMKWGHP